MLSRKHYEGIADILHDTQEQVMRGDITNAIDAVHIVINKLCKYFREDNARFDERRFCLRAVIGKK